MTIIVVMVGPKPAYNWVVAFQQREGEHLSSTFKRAEAWGHEKAGANDRVWTESMAVMP